MAIFYCSNCGSILHWRGDIAGLTVRCPSCEAKVTVPENPGYIKPGERPTSAPTSGDLSTCEASHGDTIPDPAHTHKDALSPSSGAQPNGVPKEVLPGQVHPHGDEGGPVMASLVIPSDESARGFGGTDNSRAVGSLTCGIAGSAIPPFGIILGTVAIALGASASKRIRTDPGRFGGKGMATGGIILGIVALVLGVFALVVFLVQVIK